MVEHTKEEFRGKSNIIEMISRLKYFCREENSWNCFLGRKFIVVY